ncbi:RnfABCDGE type electron transport complex subunit G [Porphyromonas circumdentaria]|uniref:Ion-translocating oxidoreductase complex subunit G n=1 Tax=Porphyromonas circumdentaria TaxID=29524 RepID=A0A1T4NN75_9PORP|nr:RnfABCDGE type electron transport complex subunit G [Porphyromonas circumdentaria]MBB6276138.1 electron transport complex protein RnfG [Porphyromonas circumdentaria]MDO4721632.1 RnfABCDGE type electron transport complex subunit G [Porphyromonas circumdentaria]SJZ80663.1 electron transport complex protein RnfG [Porphyromonas circumdentaria]
MKKLASTFPNMLLSLTIICLVVGAILGVMNQVTKDPIAETELKNKTEAIKQVVPEFDNAPLDEKIEVELEGEAEKLTVYPAKKGGSLVGYAVQSYSNNGFSGRIDVMVGFEATGVIKDFSVLKHSETPGLGAKMQEWFHLDNLSSTSIRKMSGVDMNTESPLVVSKDGGKVDAITASTISSRAFLDAINRAYRTFQKVNGSTDSATSEEVANEATTSATIVEKGAEQ